MWSVKHWTMTEIVKILKIYLIVVCVVTLSGFIFSCAPASGNDIDVVDCKQYTTDAGIVHVCVMEGVRCFIVGHFGSDRGGISCLAE